VRTARLVDVSPAFGRQAFHPLAASAVPPDARKPGLPAQQAGQQVPHRLSGQRAAGMFSLVCAASRCFGTRAGQSLPRSRRCRRNRRCAVLAGTGSSPVRLAVSHAPASLKIAAMSFSLVPGSPCTPRRPAARSSGQLMVMVCTSAQSGCKPPMVSERVLPFWDSAFGLCLAAFHADLHHAISCSTRRRSVR
jgi:hypothetical protein